MPTRVSADPQMSLDYSDASTALKEALPLGEKPTEFRIKGLVAKVTPPGEPEKRDYVPKHRASYTFPSE